MLRRVYSENEQVKKNTKMYLLKKRKSKNLMLQPRFVLKEMGLSRGLICLTIKSVSEQDPF